MAWGLNVKQPRFLALCIRRTPSGKICVKSVSYTCEITVMCALDGVDNECYQFLEIGK